MSVNQENLSKLFLLLSNEIRRDILLLLNEKEEQSYTDLMNVLDVDSGKLSFHMRNLQIFLEQTPNGKYKLNSLGQQAIRYIRELEAFSTETEVASKQIPIPIASVKKRAIAFMIDLGVNFTIFIVATLITNLNSFLAGESHIELNIILFLALLWTYSTLMEGFGGQTIGKTFLDLKVVTVSGKKLSYDTAAVRNFGKCFLMPLDLILGFRLKDKRFIKYFDKFSGTTVMSLKQ
jgi:uncharacterized RDD family membrane protein YckC/DNA-binding transcriptional ArsR family regulator